jgi:hypothetical protein
MLDPVSGLTLATADHDGRDERVPVDLAVAG